MVLKLLGIAGTSFVIGLSGAMMPGPVLTVTISEGIRRGFRAGPLVVLGHGILEFFLVISLVLGLGPLLQKDVVFAAVGSAGTIIMLWMGWGMIRSLPTLQLPSATEGGSHIHPVWAGIFLSVANPYWTLWWATIGLGYIIYSQRFGVLGVAFFFAGHIFSDLAWYSAVSWAVARGRSLMSKRVYRTLIALCATALILFALWFGSSSVGKLLVL
ncbi:LysE family translocator [Thermodesulfobacteriota bacterium]